MRPNDGTTVRRLFGAALDSQLGHHEWASRLEEDVLSFMIEAVSADPDEEDGPLEESIGPFLVDGGLAAGEDDVAALCDALRGLMDAETAVGAGAGAAGGSSSGGLGPVSSAAGCAIRPLSVSVRMSDVPDAGAVAPLGLWDGIKRKEEEEKLRMQVTFGEEAHLPRSCSYFKSVVVGTIIKPS